MALPASGAISLSDVFNSGTSTISMGDIATQVLAGNSTNNQTISMDKFYYKQSFTQQATLIGTPKRIDSFLGQGWGVAISADGNTVATVDAMTGRAYFFIRSGSTWSQQGTVAYPDTVAGSPGGYFGMNPTISNDGNTVAFSESFNNSNRGCVWVYTRSGTTWTYQQKLTSSDNIIDRYFGAGVKLSGDGNTLIAGADANNSGAGKVFVFTRSGNTFTEATAFTATVPVSPDSYGSSIAISADGATIAIGTSGSSANKVYLYSRNGNTFTQTNILYVGGLGRSGVIAMSGDGKTIVTTSYWGSSPYVYTFTKTGTNNTWVQRGDVYTGNINQNWGGNIAISTDGNLVAVGTWGGTDHRLAIFKRTSISASYTFDRIITVGAAQGYTNSYFGCSVAIGQNGNTIAVGAQQWPLINPNGGGAVIIFT